MSAVAARPRTIDLDLNPKQMLLMQAMHDPKVRRIGFGGAKKGGKSFIGRVAVIKRRMDYPGSYGLIHRRAFNDVITNHVAEIRRFCYKEGIEQKWNGEFCYFTFPQFKYMGEPSTLYLGYGKDLKDVERYQGNPYLDVLFEECCQSERPVLNAIAGELANTLHPGAVIKELYTCNPIGIGKSWFRKEFVSAKTRLPGTVWIPSRWQENLHFVRMNPNYGEQLRETYKDQPWIADALEGGSWDSDPDSFYGFDPEEGGRHVRKCAIPYWATAHAGVDYGFKPSAFGVVYAYTWKERYTGRDRLHVVGEIKEWQLHEDQQAKLALETERALGLPGRLMRYADSATDKENPRESDEADSTIADAWDRCGWYTTPAVKYRKITGLRVVRKLLHKNVLTIDPSCVALIEELQNAVHEKRPDGSIGSGTDPKQPDDMQDALRYMCTEIYGIEYASAPESVWDEIEREMLSA